MTNGNKVLKAVRAGLNIKPSQALFFAGAAGSYTKQGYAETGNLDKAFAYGTLMGMAEVATESLFGGIAGTEIGKSVVSFGGKEGLIKLNIGNKYLRRAASLGSEAIE